jgi:hypothetical protein
MCIQPGRVPCDEKKLLTFMLVLWIVALDLFQLVFIYRRTSRKIADTLGDWSKCKVCLGFGKTTVLDVRHKKSLGFYNVVG